MLHRKLDEGTVRLRMNGVEINNNTQAKYLGVTRTAQGTATNANTKRIKAGSAMLSQMKERGIHCGRILLRTVLKIWQTFILPKASYGLHLVQLDEDVKNHWRGLEKSLIITTLGCFSKRTRKRLRSIAHLTTPEQLRALRMTSLKKRIQKRREALSEQDAAQRDPERLETVLKTLKISTPLTRNDVERSHRTEEEKRVRKMPDSRHGKIPPYYR